MGGRGGLQPLGVISGMVFAMVTHASHSARLTWFQALDWLRVSRMPCGLDPAPPSDKSAGEAAPGFEQVVNPAACGDQYCNVPVQPGDRSRVCGVNFFVRLPAFGGEVRVEIALQCGSRAPEVTPCEQGTHSSVWLAAADPDKAVTAPGAVAGHGREASGVATAPVRKDAEFLGKLSGKRLGDCTLDSRATQSVG